MINLIIFLGGFVFGIIFCAYVIGTKINDKFETIDDFKKWFAKIK